MEQSLWISDSCHVFSLYNFVVVQLLRCIQLFMSKWMSVCQAPLSSTISWSMLKFMSFKTIMLFNHLTLYSPLLLLPSIFPRIRVFSNELTLPIRWPKYQSFTFSISPFNEYSGLISFGIDWFDLLAVQGTLKSCLQYHNSKVLVPQCSVLLYGPTLHC